MRSKVAPPLRGRDQELARLRKLLQGTAAGTGTVVVVEGRAGLGKTAVLERTAAKRMNAKVTEVASSHVAMLSHPDVVLKVIRDAANSL